MEEALKSVFENVRYEDLIVECDQRTYHPYTTNAYDNSDDINLVIQKADILTATYDSSIYIEGTMASTDPTKIHTLTNNAPMFLFEEIRFMLGDQTIETVRLPGINSSIKGYVSYTQEESKALSHAGWSPLNKDLQIAPDATTFCTSIPLRHVLGFAEGYRRPIINMRQEIILTRAKSDLDCYQGEVDVTLKITKIRWKVPYIIPSDAGKLALYEKINKNIPITVSFHARDLYVYPNLPQTTSTASDLDHVNITNLKANINNRRYPYEQQNYDFSKNKHTEAYDEYLNFRAQYYGKAEVTAMFDYLEYQNKPVFVINCTKQNESVQNIVVDLKLELEASEPFKNGTAAYCLILHDVLLQYEPFTGLVRKT